jgi:hypothetical protein
MTSLGGKLTTLSCHPTKNVNKAEELTYFSTNIGQNLGRVFNSKSGYVHVMQLHCFETKLLNLMLKTQPKQLLGSHLLDIALHDKTDECYNGFNCKISNLLDATLFYPFTKRNKSLFAYITNT